MKKIKKILELTALVIAVFDMYIYASLKEKEFAENILVVEEGTTGFANSNKDPAFIECKKYKEYPHVIVISEYFNGNELLRYNCVYGKPDSRQYSWHENGQKYYEENYVNGMKTGAYCEWDENGKLTAEKYCSGRKCVPRQGICSHK